MLPWFAVMVKARNEKVAARVMEQKGFDTFLPLMAQRRRWVDRYRSVAFPLFPGYVFCRFDSSHRLPILTIPGVLRIVGDGQRPIPVSDSEIERLQRVASSGYRLEQTEFPEVGQRVSVVRGPLTGVEGVLAEVRSGHRLIVSISLLQRSVAVEMDASMVEALPGSKPMAPATDGKTEGSTKREGGRLIAVSSPRPTP
jgi:transcription antitermination factor NusG